MSLVIGVAAITSIGVGTWWLSPAWSLIVVGSIVLSLTILDIALPAKGGE